MLILSDRFSVKTVIPIRSIRSEFVSTLARSRPEDEFVKLTAISILRLIILSNAVKISFWVLTSTVSKKVPNYPSIPSVWHPSIIWTFTVFSLVVCIPSKFLAVNSGLLLTETFRLPLPTALRTIRYQSKSSNWLLLSREKRDIATTFVCLSVCLFVC